MPKVIYSDNWIWLGLVQIAVDLEISGGSRFVPAYNDGCHS